MNVFVGGGPPGFNFAEYFSLRKISAKCQTLRGRYRAGRDASTREASRVEGGIDGRRRGHVYSVRAAKPLQVPWCVGLWRESLRDEESPVGVRSGRRDDRCRGPPRRSEVPWDEGAEGMQPGEWRPERAGLARSRRGTLPAGIPSCVTLWGKRRGGRRWLKGKGARRPRSGSRPWYPWVRS